MFSSFSPDPSRTPTVLFLERFTKHVSIMSPVPDRPVIVVGFAPIFKKQFEGRETRQAEAEHTSVLLEYWKLYIGDMIKLHMSVNLKMKLI